MPPPEKTATPTTAAPVCGSEFEEEDEVEEKVEEGFQEEDRVGKERCVTASFHWRRRWRRRYPAMEATLPGER